MIRRLQLQHKTGAASFPGKLASRRRAAAYRVRCLMLFTFCISTFASTPHVIADPRPLIPPLASCHNYGVCPSRTAACIGLPYIPTCDPNVDGATAGPTWNLTLQEAINTALGNSEAVRNLGLVEAASRNDIVRSVITAYDPLEADALAAAEWGIFDPLFTVDTRWDRQNVPPGTSFSGIGNRPPLLETADSFATLEQLLPIGTRVRADVVTNYLFNPAKPAGLDPNPQYFSYHQVGITQPLLRGFGVDVTMAPIKIAAAEAERTDWQFKQEMLALVRSIETTYWGLYAQQQNLKAIEQAIPSFREVVRLREEQATGAVGAESEVARAQSEYYLFEQRRLDALSKIAEQQLVLRNLMGLQPNDCRNISLLAVPVTTRPFESLQAAVDTAVNTRPDVLRQRLAVYVATQERLLADNALKPQLDLNGFYRVNGLGETLDESYDSKFDNNFESWNMGFFFQIPLGRRQGRAQLAAAEFRISRERAMLNQTAHQASYEVADAYRRINWVYQQLQVVAKRQQSLDLYSQGAKAQFDSPPPGMSTVFALELYLQNLRDVTDASISANALLADYNSALARLEEVKGTLLENRLVEVAGDTTGSMPFELPSPEIQMPESVQPAPVAPAPPIESAPPQGTAVPPPAIRLPESIQAEPNAYAELPTTPAQPATEPVVEAPIEIAEPAPTMVAQPTPAIMPPPAIEMPSSLLPEPAYTAMRPTPIELPAVDEPTFEQPAVDAPLQAEPIVEEPVVAQPYAVQPYVEQPLAVMPAIEPPAFEELSVPTPAPQPEMSQPIVPPSAPIALSQPTSQPQRVDGQPSSLALTPLPQAELQMPASLKPTRQSILVRRNPQPPAPAEPMPPPSASLRLPNSIQAQPLPAVETLPAAPLEFSAVESYAPTQPLSISTSAAPQPPQVAATSPMQFPTSIRSASPGFTAATSEAASETRLRQTARPLPASPNATKPAPRGGEPQLQLPWFHSASNCRSGAAPHAADGVSRFRRRCDPLAC